MRPSDFSDTIFFLNKMCWDTLAGRMYNKE